MSRHHLPRQRPGLEWAPEKAGGFAPGVAGLVRRVGQGGAGERMVRVAALLHPREGVVLGNAVRVERPAHAIRHDAGGIEGPFRAWIGAMAQEAVIGPAHAVEAEIGGDLQEQAEIPLRPEGAPRLQLCRVRQFRHPLQRRAIELGLQDPAHRPQGGQQAHLVAAVRPAVSPRPAGSPAYGASARPGGRARGTASPAPPQDAARWCRARP